MATVAPSAGLTGLPLKPRRSSMTWWSRYDPPNMPQGNTDHWTKLKTECLAAQPVQEDRNMGTIGGPSPMPGRHDFQSVFKGSMNHQLPGDGYLSRPRTGPARSTTSSSYGERARSGFKYWLIEKPKPTNYGRYGMGSYKTVLGIGNAPRT